MKVVINKCFGGFGISNEALLRLIKMDSKIIKKIPIKDYFGCDVNEKKLKPFKEGFSTDAIWSSGLFDQVYCYDLIEENSISTRTNQDLILVVEELGEKADGGFADLKIIEIPNEVNFEIENYDGIESIHEKHRVWS